MLKFFQKSEKPLKNHLKVLVLPLLLFPAGLWSTNYYVNGVSGIDGNDGTTAKPLKTISAALAKVDSGDIIWLASAVYRETLTLRSGITLRAQPDADVCIKGSDLVSNWTLYKNAIWQIAWTVNSQQVFVDSVPLQQIGINSPLQTKLYSGKAILSHAGTGLTDMTAGSFFFDKAASKLYVWLADGSDPNKHTIEASVRNTTISIFNETLQNVQLIDLKFYHSNSTADGGTEAIVGIAGKNWVVTNCTFNDGDFAGLAVQGTGHRITNCTCDRNGDVGVKITGSDMAHRYQPWPGRPLQNIIVRGCQMNHNNYRHFNPLWGGGGMKNVPSCRNVTIVQCRASFNDGPGIWFDIGASNNLIDRCIVTDNTCAGIEYEISDNAVISNNLVLRNGNGKYSGVYGGIFVSNCDTVRVLNNTVNGNWTGIVLHWMPRSEHPSLANNSIQNNIISNNTSWGDVAMYIDSATAPKPGNNNTSDYNLFYRKDNQVKIFYTVRGGKSTYYMNLTTLANATGMERNSLYGDPRFAAPQEDNFSLTAGSPAIGKADPSTIPGSLDIFGMPRISGGQIDMGAFELQNSIVK